MGIPIDALKGDYGRFGKAGHLQKGGLGVEEFRNYSDCFLSACPIGSKMAKRKKNL